jgi:hypothetical protein
MPACDNTDLRRPRLNLLPSRAVAGLLLLLGLSLWLPPTAEAQTVSNVRPSSGAPGTTVRLTGSGFDNDGTDTVLIGGMEASVTGVFGGGTALTATIPNGPAGLVDVSVNGATLSSAFTVVTGGGSLFTPLTRSVPNVDDGVVDWVDVDGDGDLDLFLSGSSGGSRIAAVYMNEGSSFRILDDNNNDGNTDGLVGTTGGSSDWGDYDGDGDLDLVITGNDGDGPSAALYRNDGTGSFSLLDDVDEDGSTDFLNGVQDGAVAWGDADGDGDLDLVVTGSSTATIYLNDDGADTFSVLGDGDEDGNTDGFTPVTASTSDWADIDGDGDLDLVITGNDGSSPSAALYRNDGTGTFSIVDDGDEDESTDFLNGVQDGAVAWGDYNGDGAPDLVITGNDGIGPSAALYRNDGTGTFSVVNDGDEDGSTDPLAKVEFGAVAWSDVDGDGDPDLHISGQAPGAPVATVYENDGGTFSELNPNPVGNSAKLIGLDRPATSWGDLDNDGDLDLAAIGARPVEEGPKDPRTFLYENVPPPPSTLYVSPSGSDTNDGASWNSAYRTLQQALQRAVPSITTDIWIAEGRYTPDQGPGVAEDDPSASFSLVNDVDLYGGFEGTESSRAARDAAAHPTILSGDIDDNDADPNDDDIIADASDIQGNNSYNVVTGRNLTTQVRLDGLVLTGGDASGGSFPESSGGALRLDNADVLGTNLRLVGNRAEGFAKRGGALFGNAGSSLTLANSIVAGNTAATGSAFAGQASVRLVNSVLLDNRGDGAVIDAESDVDLHTVTATQNEGVVAESINSTIRVENSILWNNNGGNAQLRDDGGSSVNLENVLLQGGTSDGVGGGSVNTENNVIDADPQFTNPPATGTTPATLSEGIGLQASSPAVDDGDATLLPNDFPDLDRDGDKSEPLPRDLQSNKRVLNSTLDLGAFERVPPPILRTAVQTPPTQIGQTRSVPVVVENTSDVDLSSFSVTLLGPDTEDFSLPDPLPTTALEPGGQTTLSIDFAPRSLGERLDTVSVVSDLGRSLKIPLAGNGISIAVAPESTPQNEDTPVTLTIKGGFNPTSTAQLYARKGGTSSYPYSRSLIESDGPTADSVVLNTQNPIPKALATPRGIDIYAELSDENTTLTVPAGGLPAAARHPDHLPVSVTDVTTNAPFKEETYQMVSVPAEPESGILGTLRESYGEYDPATWRVLRWNPTRSTYREPPELDTLAPGMGAWLITEQGTDFSVNGTTVDASSPRKIPLPSGWSQVGTPFGFAVPWDSVRTTSGRSVDAPVGYDADRGFRYNRSTLTPWQGYFVYNPSDADTLVVPPIGTDGSNATTTSPGVLAGSGLSGTTSAKSSDAPSVVRVDARTGDGHPQSVWLGLHSDAKTGRDALDFAQAPPVDADVQLSILERIGGTAIPHAGSFKPLQGDGQTWSLQLRRSKTASSAQTVSLFPQTSGSLPAGYNLYLLDAEEERRITPGESVSLAPDERSSLTLILGTEAYAKRSGAAGLGTYENELRGNAPNPFSDQTTISYVLASDQTVTLTIFNVLGQRVRTLVQDRRSKGLHHVTWNGTTRYGDRAGSGVYFYRLQGEDFTETRKMVLVR